MASNKLPAAGNNNPNPGSNLAQPTTLSPEEKEIASFEEVLVALDVQTVLEEANLAPPVQDVVPNPKPSEESKARALAEEIEFPAYNAGPVALVQFFIRLYNNYKITSTDSAANIDWGLLTAEVLVRIYIQIWKISGHGTKSPKELKQDKSRMDRLIKLVAPDKVEQGTNLPQKEYRTTLFLMACMREHNTIGRRESGPLSPEEKEELRNKTTLSGAELCKNMHKIVVNLKRISQGKNSNRDDGSISANAGTTAGLTDVQNNTTALDNDARESNAHGQNSTINGLYCPPVTNNSAHNNTAGPCYFPQYQTNTHMHTNAIAQDTPECNAHGQNNTINGPYYPPVTNNNNTDLQYQADTYMHANTNGHYDTSDNTNDEQNIPSFVEKVPRKRNREQADWQDDLEVSHKSRPLTRSMTPQQGKPFASTPEGPDQQPVVEVIDEAVILHSLQVIENMAVTYPASFDLHVAPRLNQIIQLVKRRMWRQTTIFNAIAYPDDASIDQFLVCETVPLSPKNEEKSLNDDKAMDDKRGQQEDKDHDVFDYSEQEDNDTAEMFETAQDVSRSTGNGYVMDQPTVAPPSSSEFDTPPIAILNDARNLFGSDDNCQGADLTYEQMLFLKGN
eukprot:TRINITY_DN11104_c0_g1_i1.p1 TRINITY_DN11104_c0_g1~~TRINITY_DN11104_c0_g1_i1.p1  ORF type:complete len:619 (+),score=101.17 TRINITY_DN11104_c0_g1_i1:558-2414(+)